MATTRELLPCPFCGGDARLHKFCDECTTDIGFRCRHEISPNAVCKIGEKVFWVEHECDVVDTNGEPLSSPCFSSASEAIAAWNTRATNGTLTAEQVREAIERHGTASLGCRWLFTDSNLQAIADELNAELGSVTISSEAANPQVRCTDSKRNTPVRDREDSHTLLPCPFCGNEPERQHFNISPHLQGRIICSCGAEMRHGRNQTSAELLEAWNRRADRTCRIVMNGPLGTCSLCGDECFGDSHAAR